VVERALNKADNRQNRLNNIHTPPWNRKRNPRVYRPKSSVFSWADLGHFNTRYSCPLW